MKLCDIKPLAPHILICGASGSGKTALLQTLGKRIQIFDFERGWTTGRTLKDEHYSSRLEVDIAGSLDGDGQPIGYVDLDLKAPTAWLRFRQDIFNLAQFINASKKSPYPAYGFDGLSGMFDMALHYVLGGQKAGENKIEFSYWNLAFNEICNVLSILRGLPTVVILTALDQRDEIKRSKSDLDPRFIIEPGIPGKNMPGKTAATFEECWYLQCNPAAAGKISRTIQTQNDGLMNAKSRLSLANGTDISVGLVKLLERAGFIFPEIPQPTIPSPTTLPQSPINTTVK